MFLFLLLWYICFDTHTVFVTSLYRNCTKLYRHIHARDLWVNNCSFRTRWNTTKKSKQLKHTRMFVIYIISLNYTITLKIRFFCFSFLTSNSSLRACTCTTCARFHHNCNNSHQKEFI